MTAGLLTFVATYLLIAVQRRRALLHRADHGTECDWGTVQVWEPPRRLVLAWQVTHPWGYEPDLQRSSEVEVRFTPEAGGSTRVDLEHRYLHRHGLGADALRTAIDSPNGWSGLLGLFAARVEQAS